MEQNRATTTEVDPWTTQPCRCGGALRSVDCAECASRRRELRVHRALELLRGCPHPPAYVTVHELEASDADHRVQRENCGRCGATRVTVNGEPNAHPQLGEWEQPALVRLLLAHRRRVPPMFCRACGCTEDEPCFLDETEPIKRQQNVIFLPARAESEQCAWAGEYLCTFCAAKGSR